MIHLTRLSWLELSLSQHYQLDFLPPQTTTADRSGNKRLFCFFPPNERHAHSLLRVQPGEIRNVPPPIQSYWSSAYINMHFWHTAITIYNLIGWFGKCHIFSPNTAEVCLDDMPAGAGEKQALLRRVDMTIGFWICLFVFKTNDAYLWDIQCMDMCMYTYIFIYRIYTLASYFIYFDNPTGLLFGWKLAQPLNPFE